MHQTLVDVGGWRERRQTRTREIGMHTYACMHGGGGKPRHALLALLSPVHAANPARGPGREGQEGPEGRESNATSERATPRD